MLKLADCGGFQIYEENTLLMKYRCAQVRETWWKTAKAKHVLGIRVLIIRLMSEHLNVFLEAQDTILEPANNE